MRVKVRRYLNTNDDDIAEYYDDVDVVQCDKLSGARIVWVGSPDGKGEPHDMVVTIQRTDRIIRSDNIDIWVVGKSFSG